MVQRVTVTIPDELGGRLDAVKNRFNVSRVCAEAIELEVTRQECSMKEPKDMEKIVKRLKAEKRQLIEELKDLGRKEGLEAAETMSYADLKQVEGIAEEIGESTCATAESLITSSPLWKEWLCESVEETKKDLTEGGAGFDQEAYIDGWVEGVMVFWKKVEDKL